jgi:hypothetical protein
LDGVIRWACLRASRFAQRSADAGGSSTVAWGFVVERAAIEKGPTNKGDASFSPAFVLFGVE